MLNCSIVKQALKKGLGNNSVKKLSDPTVQTRLSFHGTDEGLKGGGVCLHGKVLVAGGL